MFKLSASILAIAFAAAQVSAQATVNSINPVQCQPVAITWSGATGDVFLSIVQGSDTAAAPLRTFPTQSGASGSYTWSPVNIPAGTEITIVINDGSGQQNFSGQATVAAGNDSCNPTLAAESASGSTAPSSAASTDAASSTAAGSSSAPSSSAASSSASKPSNGASTTSASRPPASSSAAGNGNGAADLKMNSGLTLGLAGLIAGAGYALF